MKGIHCSSIGLQDGLCPELGLEGGSIIIDNLLAVHSEAEGSVAYAQNLIKHVIRGVNVDSANLSSVSKSTNSSDGAGLGDGRNVPGDGVGRRQGIVGRSSVECG